MFLHRDCPSVSGQHKTHRPAPHSTRTRAHVYETAQPHVHDSAANTTLTIRHPVPHHNVRHVPLWMKCEKINAHHHIQGKELCSNVSIGFGTPLPVTVMSYLSRISLTLASSNRATSSFSR